MMIPFEYVFNLNALREHAFVIYISVQRRTTLWNVNIFTNFTRFNSSHQQLLQNVHKYPLIYDTS